jgi:hypothetical protein
MGEDTAAKAAVASSEQKFDREADLRRLVEVLRTRNAMKPCTCPHTRKKHKQSGRCRKGCDCDFALRKAERKRKRDEHV